MSESEDGWASPSGDPHDRPGQAGSWQPPTYAPSYPGPAPQPVGYPPAPQPGWQGWAPAWTPMPGVVPLRPLGVGELLDGGVKIIRRYPKPTLALSAVVSIVVTLINVAFLLMFTQSQTLSAQTTTGDSFGNGFNGAGLPGSILDFLAGAVLTGALVTVVSRAVLGQPASVTDAWTATRPRIWALLGVTLLRGLILAAPILLVLVLTVLTGPLALLLMLPVIPLEIWVVTVLAVAPAALVLERIGVMASLRRSRVLVMRSFWRMLGMLALAWLITSVIASILTIPVVIIAELPLFTGGTATLGAGFFIVTAVVSGVVQTFLAPYSAGLRALLYVDLRMRTEGLDVALQTAAATPAAAPSA
ncbi:MAG: hypothetical protein ABR549_12125 [Mycobacteriales bacterium]